MSNELKIIEKNNEIAIPSPTEIVAYSKAIQKLPVLTEEEEKALAEKWFNEKDINAAKQLILSHLRLVVKIARDHSGYGTKQEDLIQEGNVGLMKAVRKFNPYKGVRLSSYAMLWIEAEIKYYIINNWRSVKIGGTSAMKKLFFNYRKTLNALENEGEKDLPNVDARIAQRLGVTVDEVKEAQKYFVGNDLAYENTNSEGDEFTLDYEIENNSVIDKPIYSQDPALLVEHKKDSQSEILLLEKAISSLNEREQDIFVSRKLSEPNIGLQELSNKWGISMERVRQIENSAMKKITTFIKDELKVIETE